MFFLLPLTDHFTYPLPSLETTDLTGIFLPRTHISESQPFSLKKGDHPTPKQTNKHQLSRSYDTKKFYPKKKAHIPVHASTSGSVKPHSRYSGSGRSQTRRREGGEGTRESEFVKFLWTHRQFSNCIPEMRVAVLLA